MPRWEELRYRPGRVTLPMQADGTVYYNLDKARAAHAEMQVISWHELYDKLKTPRQVCFLPYPGIGVLPRRADLKFAGRAQMEALFKTFIHAYEGRGRGYIIHVTGPKGVGKSCYLRGLAWLLLLEDRDKNLNARIVCLWSMESAYRNLFGEVIAALRFTYCQAQDVLQEIDSLESLEGVEKFMDRRLALGETFYFIVDGAESLDTNISKVMAKSNEDFRATVDMQLSSLLWKAHVSIKALSPTPDSSTKRKGDLFSVHFEQGFWKEEYDTYITEASVLGRLPQWQEEIDYFAGQHPLSLSVLDSACRFHALKRSKAGVSDGLLRSRSLQGPTSLGPSDEEIAELLKDKDEWDEAVKLFLSSAEMASIRFSLAETLSSMPSACHSQLSMMARDMRFVVGDPRNGDADYVTPYIRRMYIEGFREAESRRVYEKTAWQHYCRYLLVQGGPTNWAEMGWLVENLVAEVISFRGLNLDGMAIPSTARTQKFGGVPDYDSWIFEVEAGGAIYFILLKYNYRSIDGLLVWRHGSGPLHLIAIQVTVDDMKHQARADEFMSFNNIVNWIPREHLSKWELHFVFICMRSLITKEVPERLNPTKSCGGGCDGNVKYSLHTVSFEDAFTGSNERMNMLQTLKDVARKRDEASEPAEEEAQRLEF